MQYYFCLIRNETNLKYKTGDNKMKQDKNTFVESRKSEIEMEKAFIKSCDVLKKHAMKWNGKVINALINARSNALTLSRTRKKR